MIKLKRAYEKPERSDGTRILVDRLWPRGLTHRKIHVKEWMKDIAPTKDLIEWFGHDDKKWPEFRKRYKQQLKKNKELVNQLKAVKNLTLIYSAKDEEHNNAVVLKEVLEI